MYADSNSNRNISRFHMRKYSPPIDRAAGPTVG